jgi:phosphate transport system protein
MRLRYSTELDQINAKVLQMATLVRDHLDLAAQALMDRDDDKARRVIADDQKVDALEDEILDKCVLMLARQNPVASDLRDVVTTIRLSSELERMGDISRHIAEAAHRAAPESAIPDQATDVIDKMQRRAQEVAQQMFEMFRERSTDIAHDIIGGDDVMDGYHRESYEIINSPQWHGTTQDVVNLVLLARYFERFGDHCVSLAKRLIYIVSGFDPNRLPDQDREDD